MPRASCARLALERAQAQLLESTRFVVGERLVLDTASGRAEEVECLLEQGLGVVRLVLLERALSGCEPLLEPDRVELFVLDLSR